MRPWGKGQIAGKPWVGKRVLGWLFVGLFCTGQAWCADVKTVSLEAFASQMDGAQALLLACIANAGACDPAGLPGREQVQGGPAGPFFATWGWMSRALTNAKDAPAADRKTRMQEASAHLAELRREAGISAAPSAAEFGKARLAANAALARGEFQAAEGPTWIERRVSKMQDWLLRLFTGIDRLGKRAPWLAPAIEWGCFGLAAGGLLWFVRQSLARQTLRISLSEGAALAARGERDPADWAELARQRAEAGDWREAIHCVYWAAIALLEGRRAWKPNATRTPREYVRLLKPGTEAQSSLRELTRIFERIWYGYGVASAGQYHAAMQILGRLETARPERAGAATDGPQTGPVPAAGGA